ncbi:TadE/TadG family type IV pilus assembly protein [Compostimonas suwonensis]|uniref:TadE-like protein n=1 Tax=Compostimonas suwonensis TaxID=1048394 RepID=A0A2M9BWR3_9MICO|nr:TadE/TadG family type IV pilus assembly protein [Compostimonas suwonensis]PJJ62378.1 TadE-like protein [Compostimonas suwonensis]
MPARAVRSDEGSAVAEFVMVGALLTLLVLAVLQLAFALHVRNTILDAAAEGARHAALLGSDLAAGEARTRDLVATALSPGYARDITASLTEEAGIPSVRMRVVAPLPLLGFVGIDEGLEVTGRAARETLVGG